MLIISHGSCSGKGEKKWISVRETKVLADDYETREPISEILERITDGDGHHLHLSQTTVRRYWKEHELVKRTRGWPTKEVSDEVLRYVARTYQDYPMGMTKLYETAVVTTSRGLIQSYTCYTAIEKG
jgi:hypothetical protein